MSQKNSGRRFARTPASQPKEADSSVAAPVAPQPPSKIASVVALLGGENGASLDELVAATGWQPHTTRAALTGLRKKGYQIARTKVEGVTRYTIAAGDPQ